MAQEAKERAAALAEEQVNQRRQQEMNLKRLNLQAQIAALQAELDASEKQIEVLVEDDEIREQQAKQNRVDIAKSRGA